VGRGDIGPRAGGQDEGGAVNVPNWAGVGDEATALLSRYLQIDTTNPPGHELAAAEFLAAELERRGLSPVVYPSAPGRGNVVARLPRTVPATEAPGEAQPSEAQPSEAIILLHHMDVVTADPVRWSCDPFGGEVRDGYVWGRGALDMKGMGVMQLLALDLLLHDGCHRARDLIFLAVADEEVSSEPGARWMLAHHGGLRLGRGWLWAAGGLWSGHGIHGGCGGETGALATAGSRGPAGARRDTARRERQRPAGWSAFAYSQEKRTPAASQRRRHHVQDRGAGPALSHVLADATSGPPARADAGAEGARRVTGGRGDAAEHAQCHRIARGEQGQCGSRAG